MNTPSPEIQIPAAGRRHPRYSDEFKRQVVAACHEPGVSKAAIALANGLNANMLRRWVVQSSQASHGQLVTTTKPLPSVQANADFIPIKLTPAPSTQAGDIRIELQHAKGTIQIHWPMVASNQCAQWMREVLA
jgi:transposase-like protein